MMNTWTHFSRELKLKTWNGTKKGRRSSSFWKKMHQLKSSSFFLKDGNGWEWGWVGMGGLANGNGWEWGFGESSIFTSKEGPGPSSSPPSSSSSSSPLQLWKYNMCLFLQLLYKHLKSILQANAKCVQWTKILLGKYTLIILSNCWLFWVISMKYISFFSVAFWLEPAYTS